MAAAALAGGKQGIPPTLYNETAVIGIVADTIREGFDNGRIIAERLNEAGYQTKAGKAWDKDIYSAWKRQGSHADKLAESLRCNPRLRAHFVDAKYKKTKASTWEAMLTQR